MHPSSHVSMYLRLQLLTSASADGERPTEPTLASCLKRPILLPMYIKLTPDAPERSSTYLNVSRLSSSGSGFAHVSANARACEVLKAVGLRAFLLPATRRATRASIITGCENRHNVHSRCTFTVYTHTKNSCHPLNRRTGSGAALADRSRRSAHAASTCWSLLRKHSPSRAQARCP